MNLVLPYAHQEIERLITQYYPHYPTKVLAVATGLTESQIYRRAYALGLKKSPELIAMQREIQVSKLLADGANYRFKPGQTSHNKGKKMPKHIYDKVKRTMFKKGNRPHNTREEGAVRIQNDKSGSLYIYKRVSKGKWALLHRLIWEEHNGKIPKGYNVVFKDHNPANLNIENLELLSNAELMIRNSVQRFPEDLRRMIQAVGALNRQLNKIKEPITT